MVIDSVIRAVELWISVFPFTVVGILLASIAVELGIFDRLFPVMKPILHEAHFTPHSGIAFMTAFGSPIAAVAMISEFYGEGKINQKETLLATVATWFPQTIYESFVYISYDYTGSRDSRHCISLFIRTERHDSSSARIYCRQSTFDPEKLYRLRICV
ncbi:nucleoside recognition domain-containing protein [Methanosarcina horonobensis]|uniref:nucleoside recognition domain-containing protein n=1 Tax=Methanosarcina horonobensis TaxID=418008 RepID=UPI000A6528EB|nr:nucleoside recognition domain-containing protein [Methanosarcina horonobensis]